MEKLPARNVMLPYDWTNPSAEGACSDLIATWEMNEGKGKTTGPDQLQGSISGPAWLADPQMGTTLNFSGSGDHVTVRGNSLLKTPQEEITIGIWFKSGESFAAGTTLHRQDLVSKKSNYNLNLGPFGAAAIPDLIICLDGRHTSASGHFAPGKGFTNLIVNDNRWHHLAATYDGSAIKLYKNGELVLDRRGLTGVVGNPLGYNSTNPVYFGTENGRSRFFKGSMAGVSIYNRALAEEEISHLARQKTSCCSRGGW